MQNEYPTVAYWMGRPVKDLSKDELIEAVTRLGRMLEESNQSHMDSINMLLACNRAMRS